MTSEPMNTLKGAAWGRNEGGLYCMDLERQGERVVLCPRSDQRADPHQSLVFVPPPPHISTPISIPHTQHEPLLGDWVQKWTLASDIHQKLVLLEDPGMFQEGLKLAMLGRTTNKALF